jgi:hypothetical protein
MKVTKATNAKIAVYTVYGANGEKVGIVRAELSQKGVPTWWDVIDTYHGYKVLKSCFSFKQAKAWAEDDGNWFEAWVKSGDLKLTLEFSQEVIDAVS